MAWARRAQKYTAQAIAVVCVERPGTRHAASDITARGKRHVALDLQQAGGRDAGPAFVVVANHFKSKGCGEAKGAEADQGDGQACWNPTRVESARLVDQWLATDPTGTGSDLVAFVGDLNAYSQEDPLRYLRAQGWSDALPASADSPHSFVFDGQAGRLDHALLSPALARGLAGATVWHSNADEPLAGRGEGGEPWRASDHDPLLIGLDL